MSNSSEMFNRVYSLIEQLRVDVTTWGISEEGKKQVRNTLDGFEKATKSNEEVARVTGMDLSPFLQIRLENMYLIKVTIDAWFYQAEVAMQTARDVSWLPEWVRESGDPASLMSNKQRVPELQN